MYVMNFNPEPEKKKLTLRLSEDAIAYGKQRADELGLSVSALVEQLFEAMQAPTEAPSSEFQALMDALEKVPPRSEDQFDPQDPYYKSAAAGRHE